MIYFSKSALLLRHSYSTVTYNSLKMHITGTNSYVYSKSLGGQSVSTV